MEKSKSGDLFEKTPEIHKIEILADKPLANNLEAHVLELESLLSKF